MSVLGPVGPGWKPPVAMAVEMRRPRPWAATTLRLQGLYFLFFGLWPIVHMPSFEAVTGPKVDDWLVKTVGALTVAIGLPLLAAARRAVPAREALLLGAAVAVAFAVVDFVYVANGTLRPIYLADAAIELLFLAGLARGARERARTAPLLGPRRLGSRPPLRGL